MVFVLEKKNEKKEKDIELWKTKWVKKWSYDEEEEKKDLIKWRKVENGWMCWVMKVILVLKVVEFKIRRLSSFIC